MSSYVTPDILMDIRYAFKDAPEPNTCVIYTNAKPEVLDELLSNWVQDQMFKGRDVSSPNLEKPEYQIKIGLVLEDDSFCTESDTGNYGLTTGIVMEILGRLKEIPVKGLGERPEPAPT